MNEPNFAVAKCVMTTEGRCWLDSQPCANLEDGLIVIEWLKSQSSAWAVLAVIARQPNGAWATVHFWDAVAEEQRRKRVLH